MEDYASSVTGERVRRAIKGVPKSTNFKEGLGGSFSYFEVGNGYEMIGLLIIATNNSLSCKSINSIFG